MSCMSVIGDTVAVARDSLVNLYNINSDHHTILRLPCVDGAGPSPERDFIVDTTLSPDGAFLAVMTGPSKRLIIYELSDPQSPKLFTLPRAASRARFTADSSQVLVADKTGDALLYDFKDPACSGTKLFGHLSLLLDILMTDDDNYVITSDRDEKIRVSHYPNTYNVKSYCLGHKEFVKHIQLLPNDKKYLLSASGDGTVKVWDYVDGRLCHTIETTEHVDDKQCLKSFVETMDKDGVEVFSLPIVHMNCVKIDSHSSLIAVAAYSYNKILIYLVKLKDQQFETKLLCSLILEQFPSALQLNDNKLFVCLDGEQTKVQVYRVAIENCDASISLSSTHTMFTGEDVVTTHKEADINLLYKRKFDNVQEYHERKRQRLEKYGES